MTRARILAIAAAAFLAMAACGDEGGASNDALGIPEGTAAPQITVQTDHGAGMGNEHGGEAECTSETATQTIRAHDTHFDNLCLGGPADTPFQITFVNDDATEYNVAFFTDHTGAESIYRGEYVSDGEIVYDLPALPAGEYAFHSEIATEELGHGTLIIG